jgi:hypothetical protein
MPLFRVDIRFSGFVGGSYVVECDDMLSLIKQTPGRVTGYAENANSMYLTTEYECSITDDMISKAEVVVMSLVDSTLKITSIKRHTLAEHCNITNELNSDGTIKHVKY